MSRTPAVKARRGRPPRAEAGDTRRRILAAALDGFSQDGFAGTSIRRIARAAGIRESAVYNHFPSKRAIFEALLAQSGPGVVVDLLASGVERSAGPAVAIRQLVEGLMAACDEPRARRFISLALREGGPASPLFGTGLAKEIRRAQKVLGAVFQEWMDAGLLRSGFPAGHLVWELMAPLAMIRVTSLRADSTAGARREGLRLAGRHLDHFLACNLTTPPARSARSVRRARPDGGAL